MSRGFTGVTGSVVIRNPTKTPPNLHLSKRNMHIQFQDKFPVPPPNLILALKPPPDRNGGRGRAVAVFLRIFCPLLGRDRPLAGTRKVLASANAILHIQRGPPDPQPARETLAGARPWKPCYKHLV